MTALGLLVVLCFSLPALFRRRERPVIEPRPVEPPHEDRDLQRQQHQQAPLQSSGWLKAAKPDVVSLQELKAPDGKFPRDAIEKAGYGAVWRGEKSVERCRHPGARREPVLTRTELPGDPADSQSRYIEAAVNGVIVASLYAPNGNRSPGRNLITNSPGWSACGACRRALCRDVPVVLAGDYNVVPTERDIYPSKSYAKNAWFSPRAARAVPALLDQGWVDAIRELHPDEPIYTFWDYLRNRWPRDAGLRLDHLLLSRRRQAPGRRRRRSRGAGHTGASDHAPACIVLERGTKAGKRAAACPAARQVRRRK